MPVFSHYGLFNNQELIGLLEELLTVGKSQQSLQESQKFLLEIISTQSVDVNVSALTDSLSSILLEGDATKGSYGSPTNKTILPDFTEALILSPDESSYMSIANVGKGMVFLKFGEAPLNDTDYHVSFCPGFNDLKFEHNQQQMYFWSNLEASSLTYAFFVTNNTPINKREMIIKPLVGTGGNWTMGNLNIYPWWVNEINSVNSGFKLFLLEEVTPHVEITLSLDTGTLDYDQTETYPINFYLFSLTSFPRLFFTLQNYMLPLSDMGEVRALISEAKKYAWAARAFAAGGQVKVTPTSSKMYGLIDVKISSFPYAETAVFDWVPVNNQFIIKGV